MRGEEIWKLHETFIEIPYNIHINNVQNKQENYESEKWYSS